MVATLDRKFGAMFFGILQESRLWPSCAVGGINGFDEKNNDDIHTHLPSSSVTIDDGDDSAESGGPFDLPLALINSSRIVAIPANQAVSHAFTEAPQSSCFHRHCTWPVVETGVCMEGGDNNTRHQTATLLWREIHM